MHNRPVPQILQHCCYDHDPTMAACPLAATLKKGDLHKLHLAICLNPGSGEQTMGAVDAQTENRRNM